MTNAHATMIKRRGSVKSINISE